MNPLYDLIRRWPYTTAWVIYVVYVATVFWLSARAT